MSTETVDEQYKSEGTHQFGSVHYQVEVNATLFEEKIKKMSSKNSENSFVISGIAGRYPECRNVNELKKNLFDQVDMVTDREVRWSNSIWSELPKRKGIVSDVERFDATFFGIHAKLANKLDPQSRIMVELAYEAIIDAGVHPEELRGSRTNVYIASGLPETFASQLCDSSAADGKVSMAGLVCNTN